MFTKWSFSNPDTPTPSLQFHCLPRFGVPEVVSSGRPHRTGTKGGPHLRYPDSEGKGGTALSRKASLRNISPRL